MAFTQHAQFSYSVEDELGTKANIVVYANADPTKTIANLAADWEALAALIDPVIGGQITGGSARLVLVPSGAEKTAPAAGSRVEQTAVFDLTNTATPRLFGEAIASLKDSLIVAGAINLADADVAALVAALYTATANTQPTNNSFQPLSGLHDAFVSFRKRRKQLTRSSYEVA